VSEAALTEAEAPEQVAEAALPGAALPRARAVNTRGATLRAVYIIWYRDVLRYYRDRWRLLASLAQPILFLLVFGTGLSSSLRGASAGFGGRAAAGLQYQQFIYPGIIGMAVLLTAIFGAMSIVWDREFGFLKEVLVAPINRAAVAVGKTLGGATQAMLQGLLLLVLAPLVGVTLTWQGVLELIPLIFVYAFALSALGVAVGAQMRSMQGFQVVMNFLMMPIFFLAGALFPLQGLPVWMTVLTRLDPASYGIDPLRRTVLGAAGVPSHVLDGLGLTLFGQTLAIWVEEALLIGFGLVMLSFAIRSFQHRD
jgi:ABC-2 type transport system permease protein